MSGRGEGAAAPTGPQLAGRRMLVTGPSGRLTRDIAHEARERGALVALATPAGGEAALGSELPWFRATLGGERDVDHLVDDVAARLTGLDSAIAVVTAAPLAALHEMSLERWRDCVTEPLRGIFWLARRAVEGFLADGVDGRIVLVVEPLGNGRESHEVLESALRSFARSFAREYGRRELACNLVLPSPSGPGVALRDPLPAIVEHALFLASAAASFVNGEALLVASPLLEPDARG